MTETQSAPAAIPRQPLFYQRPEPLTLARHSTWRIKPGSLRFAAETAWVPIAASEFVEAAQSYPVLFAGEEHIPVALLGLTGRNRFVQEDAWRADAYVPAYVRRYPFVFTQMPGGLALAIDTEAPSVIKDGDEGMPLFVDGKPSELTEQAMKFCEAFSREFTATQALVKLLEEHKLLIQRVIEVGRSQAEKTALTDFSVIDISVFTALPEELVADWHRRGILATIYAHLGSLGRLPTLLGP
jgi:hypothetical protein